MSAQPKPLYELVREWERRTRTVQSTNELQAYTIKRVTEAHIDELRAALKAWAEQLDVIANQQSGTLTINSIKWRVLGVEEYGKVKTQP